MSRGARKRAILLLLLCLLSFVAFAQIPNGGFENWSGGNPVGWATSNAPPVYTNVTATTVAHTGNYAVEGIVIPLGPSTIEPVIQVGPTARGFAWNQRSVSFTGYYQFSPQGGDRFGINVGLFKNGVDGIHVASAALADPTPRTGWTAFNVPFAYLTGDTPDTCIVQILIAGPDVATRPHGGSTFLLDDIGLTSATSVEDAVGVLPHVTTLEQNYPNPFNPATEICFTVAPASLRFEGTQRAGLVEATSDLIPVSLRIYDLLGREVATLVNEQKNPGTHKVRFDATGLPSGVYLYRLQAGQFAETKRLVLLR